MADKNENTSTLRVVLRTSLSACHTHHRDLGFRLFLSIALRTAPGNGRMYIRMYRRNPYCRAYKAPFSIGVRLLGLNDGDWGGQAVEERGFSSLHSETGYSLRL